MAGGPLISVQPDELTFELELEKPAYCNLKLSNNSEHPVAFKVKTTSPKKYFVRPNSSVIQPWDSCTVTVTHQAQNELPADNQCKDKFLIQSTKVPLSINFDEIPPDTFVKDELKVIEELKLRVVYVTKESRVVSSGGESGITSATRVSMRSSDAHALQRLREERDIILRQNNILQREVEMLKSRIIRRNDAGFSMTFAAYAALIGLLLGLMLHSVISSRSTA